MLQRIHQHVLAAHPDTSLKLINESIRRIANRRNQKYINHFGHNTGKKYFKEQALKPLNEVSTEDSDHEKTVRATRYRRLPKRRFNYARLTLGEGKPFRGPMGERITEHKYHE